MKSKENRRYIKVILVISAIIYFVGFVLVPKVVAQGALNLVWFYRVRFEVLGQSPKGLHYNNLFDVHIWEIMEIVTNNSASKWETIDILLKWQPKLDALVNGHGDEAVISEQDVASVKNYLNLIAQHASPELASVIQEELAASPLEDAVGMTMNQAWTYLNKDPRFQGLGLQPQEFPYLKADSTNTITGIFSETSKYEITFDEETWALSSWNNGVAGSWVAEPHDLSDCILTIPWTVSDPYLPLAVSYKTLGDVEYEVQAPDSTINNMIILYIRYQPIEIAGRPLQGDHPPFIVYPGVSNADQCIEQSEAVLASLHFVSDAVSQPIQ